MDQKKTEKDYQKYLDTAARYIIYENPVTDAEIQGCTVDKVMKCSAVFEAIKTKLKGLYGEAFVIPNDIFGEKSDDLVAFSAQWFLKTGGHGKFSVVWNRQMILKLKFTRNLLNGCSKVATVIPPKCKATFNSKPEDYLDVRLNNGIYYFLRRNLDEPFMFITVDPAAKFNGGEDTFEKRIMAFVDTFLMA